jgi:hypothetical protein
MLFLGISERNREGRPAENDSERTNTVGTKLGKERAAKGITPKGKEPIMKGGSKERNREQQSIDKP